MRSIRLSLVVYLLVLLGCALGAVSWFSYINSQDSSKLLETQYQQALQDKEVSTRKWLERQYEENRKQVEDGFDLDLLRQANDLSKMAVFIYHQAEPLFALGLIGTADLPLAHLTTPLWLAEAFYPLHPKVWWTWNPRLYPSEVRLVSSGTEDERPFMSEGQFYQTFRWDGHPYERSETLQLEDVWMQLDRDIRRKAEGQEQFVHYDETEVLPETKVRRVTIKTRVNRSRSGAVIPLRLGSKFSGKAPGPPGGRTRLPIFLQFASDTSQRDESLLALEQKLEQDLAKLASETREAQQKLGSEAQQALADLRTRILWIGLGTFGALVIGICWLVRHGLSPLERLSEAVREVSPRDFRLNTDPARLPKELQPIALRLVETLEQLKRAFAREKQAAADISHELRTPLATLLTTLDVALNKPRSPDEYREILEDCRLAGQQMTHLVERLLALARLDAGADPLRPRDVDLAYLAKQCADLVRPLAQARGLTLRVNAQGPASLRADPDKIREVLTNLLHNAIEYNRPNGSVELAVERQNGHVCLQVRDTGIGIAPEVREHIFERFFRADPARNPDGLHAGLGLAIVKGYIDLMGGSIRVDSSERGSTFLVQLPARPH
jgi:heavy metal sensor kinase